MTQHEAPDETRGVAERLRELREAADAERRQLDEALAAVRELRGDSSADDEHDPDGPTLSAEWSRISGMHSELDAKSQAIDAAVARLAAGTYGRCIRCGEPIAAGRLEARPAAALCIRCAS